MNELMRKSDDGFLIGESTGHTYCSILAETMEEKKLLYNLTSAPDGYLRDCINMELQVKHVYAETCEFVSETGEITPGVRIVLITPDGKSYQCASKGIFNSLRRLFQTVGTPDQWGDEGIRIRMKQIAKKTNRAVLTFELV